MIIAFNKEKTIIAITNHNPQFANAIHHQHNNVHKYELMKKLTLLEERINKLEKLVHK